MLIGPAFKTVRNEVNPFIQLKIQWVTDDIIEKPLKAYPDILPGCTIIKTFMDGLRNIFSFYGRDLQNNYYNKTIYTELEETKAAYKAEIEDGHQPLVVKPSNTFIVQAVKISAAEQMYMLSTKGIFLVANGSILYDYPENIYNVYEFNTIFPIITKSTTSVTYYEPDKRTQVTTPITSVPFNNSTDITWELDNYDITPYLNPNIPSVPETKEVIEYINGITMTEEVVNVDFYLASPTDISVIPENSEEQLEDIADIPIYTEYQDTPDEAYTKLVNKIDGVKDNFEVFSTYGFNVSKEFTRKWPLTGSGGASTQYYLTATNYNEAWTELPKTEDGDTYGIASLGLRAIPMLPAMSANTIGYTPEYRLFNPKFVSKTVKTLSESPIYFKLTRKSNKRWICHDGLTDSGESLAVLTRDDKKYNIWVPAYKSDRSETGVLILEAVWEEGEDNASIGLIMYDSINSKDEATDMVIPVNTPTRKQIVIGQITKPKNSIKIIQGHTGVAYFDFSEGGDAYNGTFTIKYNSSTQEVSVTKGYVRVIQTRYEVAAKSFVASSGVIYIKVVKKDGTPTITLELDTTSDLPMDTADTSHYLVGSITDGKIVQEHHGGIPLFLFFSDDCIDDSEDSTTT